MPGFSAPTPKDPWPDDAPQERTLEQTKIASWRLHCLLNAYKLHAQVLDQEEVSGLIRLADSKAELHKVVRALEQGCSLGEALSIFLDDEGD